jgi:hypothetical protein
MECLFANVAAGVRMDEPHATGSMIGSQNNRTDSPFDWGSGSHARATYERSNDRFDAVINKSIANHT